MDVIYVVSCHEGEYSDYHQTNMRAFAVEADAQAFAERCTAFAKSLLSYDQEARKESDAHPVRHPSEGRLPDGKRFTRSAAPDRDEWQRQYDAWNAVESERKRKRAAFIADGPEGVSSDWSAEYHVETVPFIAACEAAQERP